MPAPALPLDYQSIFRSLPGAYLLLAADGTVLDNSDQHVAVSIAAARGGRGALHF